MLLKLLKVVAIMLILKDEIKILKRLSTQMKNEPVIRLYDNFLHFGKNGKHICLATTLLGDDLFRFKHCYSRYDKLIPIPIIKKLAKQMLEGLDFLHNNQVIHTDIKPENILLTKKIKDIKSEDDINLCIADLGTACWTFKHFTSNVQTTEYRAPEVIIKAHYNTKIDIWSIGCVIFELLANEYVFDSKHGSHFSLKGDESESESEESISDSESSDDEEDYDTDYNQLFQMMQLFGKIPKHILKNGKYKSSFFQRNGKLKNMEDFPEQISIEQRLLCNNFSEKDAKEIHDFLTPMFNYNVSKRTTAKRSFTTSLAKF